MFAPKIRVDRSPENTKWVLLTRKGGRKFVKGQLLMIVSNIGFGMGIFPVDHHSLGGDIINTEKHPKK